MSPGDFSYDGLRTAYDLVSRVWEAGVLNSLLDGPKRYTDIGIWLTTWSATRPSDSAITRATQRLVRAGFVERVCPNGDNHESYTLTATGRERAALLTDLTTFLNHRD